MVNVRGHNVVGQRGLTGANDENLKILHIAVCGHIFGFVFRVKVSALLQGSRGADQGS